MSEEQVKTKFPAARYNCLGGVTIQRGGGGGFKILSVGGVVIQWPPVSGGRNSTWKFRWILIAARWIKTPRVEIQWGQNSILHRKGGAQPFFQKKKWKATKKEKVAAVFKRKIE